MKGMVQLMPGAIGEEQDGWGKKVPPFRLMLLSTTVSVLLLLVTVTDFAALLVPAIWLPKASVAGDIARTGGSATPVPVTVKVCAG